jgi:signal transduction histidine kinase
LKSRIGVQSKPVREKLEDMSLMIKESVESIREISSFLRPAILFDLGLVTAINYQLKNFEKQTGIKCIFNCDPQNIVLDESISIVIYRILQESLTNIARHSGATETVVDLKRSKTNILMNIKDNGVGIDKEKINSFTSLGIAGIKERIKSISGKITIGSEQGSGTRIKIIIPLKAENKND